MRAELEARKLVDKLVNRLAHLGEANQLTNLLRREVVVSLPRQILALNLDEDIVRNTLELTQRRLAAPRPPRRHLAQRQSLIRELRPTALENNLKDAPQDAPRRLRDVHHVSHEREAFELHAADVSLKQDVDLRGGLLDGFLHRDRDALGQFGEFQLLLLPHGDVLELLGEGKQAAQLDVSHRGLEVLVERFYGPVADVVVARDAAQVGGLHVATAPVVSAQARLVQLRRGGVDQIRAAHLQRGIILQRIDADSVQVGVPEHADVEVGVTEPVHRIPRVLHGAEDNLRVERIREVFHKLGLNWKLLVEQRQVVLQLAVLGDDDTLAERIELRTTGTAHHLHHVLEAELVPSALLRVVHLRTLDDHGVRRKVHTPRQGRGAHQHLHVTVREQLLDQCAVGASHAGVVDGKAVG